MIAVAERTFVIGKICLTLFRHGICRFHGCRFGVVHHLCSTIMIEMGAGMKQALDIAIADITQQTRPRKLISKRKDDVTYFHIWRINVVFPTVNISTVLAVFLHRSCRCRSPTFGSPVQGGNILTHQSWWQG